MTKRFETIKSVKLKISRTCYSIAVAYLIILRRLNNIITGKQKSNSPLFAAKFTREGKAW